MLYPVVLFIVLAGLILASFVISQLTGQFSYEKLSAYECGIEPMGSARTKFDIMYYIVAILFLIFDLELIF